MDLHRREITGNHFGNNNTIYQGDVHYHSPNDTKCLTELRTTDPRDDKSRIEATKGGLFKDSYRWILQHNDFRRWRDDERNRLLWIKGDPGKGKTMLLCGIVNELTSETSLKDQKANALLSYFFCQATDERINSATAVLRGLIYLVVEQQPLLVSHIQKKYKHGGEAIFKDVNAWTALSEIFLNILEDTSLKRTYIIIDALDECVTDLPKLLDFINTKSALFSRVKWIVSSRNWPDIEERLNSATQQMRLCLELNEKSISAAVDAYIKHQVKCLTQKKKYNAITKDSVYHHLSFNSNNTFLWVALVCKELDNISDWEVEEALLLFPPGLDDLYKRMIDQICKSRRATLYLRILAVVSTVHRPISLSELETLVEMPFLPSSNDKALEEIVGRCGSFLTLQGRTMSLVHQSAKDFFLGKDCDKIFPSGQEEVHYSIFSRSLQALSTLQHDIYGLGAPGYHIDQVQPIDPDPLAAVRYSSIYWIDHFRDSSPGENAKDDLQKDGLIDHFLHHHFLHWLEALSLLQSISKGIVSIAALKDLFREQAPDSQVLGLVQDAWRFMARNSWVIEHTPLQVYVSALIFSPLQSQIRVIYKDEEPSWILLKPAIEAGWDACLQTLGGHDIAVTSVVFSPDGQRLASSSYDKTVKVWDANSGTCLKTLNGHDDVVTSVVFSPDGQRLASSSKDKTVKIWDANSGACLQTLNGHNIAVTSVVFSPNNQRLASSSYDKTVKIWDINSGACLQSLSGHNGAVESVVFSPNSQQLASSSYDKTVKIWDANSGTCLQSLRGHDDAVISVVFSPDGQRLASSSYDKTVKVWDANSGACLQTLNGHDDMVTSVVFSPDGQRLASSSKDKTVKVWDANSGACLQTLNGHDDTVTSVVFSPDGQRLASSSHNMTVKVWDINLNTYFQTLNGHDDTITSVVFSPDGQRLASSSYDKTVKIWDTNSGAYLQTLKGHDKTVVSVVFSPDGQRLASSSNDETVKIWDINSGACLQSFKGHNREVTSVVFSPDGQRLASSSWDKTVRVWDSQRLASSSWNIIARVWDTNSGACLKTLNGHDDAVISVVFSPDGQRLASSSYDKTVKVWDANLGACLQTLNGHDDTVTSVVFSPDSQRLASSSWDKTVKVWDANSGACLQTVYSSNTIQYLEFDATDNSRLLTNVGVLKIDNSIIKLPTEVLLRHTNLHDYGISSDTWITKDNKPLIWLPVEHRPTASALFGATVIIGGRSGRVLVMRFSID